MDSSIVITNRLGRKSAIVVAFSSPKSILRCVYYAFVFSFPFEVVETGIVNVTYAKMLGYLLIVLALAQWRLCFKLPPKAFWCFVIYLVIYSGLGLLVFDQNPQDSEIGGAIVSHLFTLCQLLVLFWISYNLLQAEIVMKGTLLTFAIACVVVACFQVFGVVATYEGGRASVFNENPNELATVLSLALLALVGLAYGRKDINKKIRLLAWLSCGFLLISIVGTGSRGNLLALIPAFWALVMKSQNPSQNVKTALVVLLLMGSLGWIAYHNESAWERWEATYFEEDTAGRDKIFEEAWGIFLEKPLIGWGPVNHLYELGRRLGLVSRDTHNLYLWMLTQSGLLGAIPFFMGVWLCYKSAWKARNGPQGTLPAALISYLLIVNLKGTYLVNKYVWVLLAYACASGSRTALPLHHIFLGGRRAVKLHKAEIKASPGIGN